MKECPSCKTIYSDENLRFCLQDGTPLVAQTNSKTEAPLVAQTNSETETPTVAFETTDLDKSYTTNKDAEQVRVHIPDSQGNWGHSQQTRIVTEKAPTNGSKTLVAVLATALVMLLLFGAGIGAYVYFSNQNGEIAQDSNKNDDEDDRSNTDSVLNPSAEKNRKPAQKKTPTKQPIKFNPEDIKEEIENSINTWTSLAEARNLNEYVSKYASRVDYYKKKNASFDFVKKDKQRAFQDYNDIDIEISRMNIEVDSTGERAIAAFDKEWSFSGAEKSTEGKVRSQLKFRKIGGVWKITGEKDLKVYRVKRD